MNWKRKLPRQLQQVLSVGFILVLMALPLVLLVFAWEREFDQDHAKSQEEAAIQIENKMDLLLDPGFLLNFFRDFILFRFCDYPPDVPMETTMFTKIQELKREYPNTFEMVIFDTNNQVVASYSDLSEFHSLMNHFGPEMLQGLDGISNDANLHLNRYRGFLGLFWTGVYKRNQVNSEWLADFCSLARRRAMLIIFLPVYHKPWLMVWISLPENAREFVYRLYIRRQGLESERNTIFDVRAPIETWGYGLKDAMPIFPEALKVLGEQMGKAVFAEGFIWWQLPLTNQKRWIVALPDRAFAVLQTAKLRLRGGCVFLLLLLLWGFNLWQKRNLSTVSLRIKLLFLFVYTTGIPLFLLFLSAQGLFTERRQVMEKKIFREQEQAILEFDRRCSEYSAWMEEVAARIKGKPLEKNGSQLKLALKRISTFIGTLKPEICELFDERGSSLLHFAATRQEVIGKMMPVIGMQIAKGVAALNKTEISLQDSAKEQAIKASVESIGFDIDEMSANMVDSGDHMSPSNFGGNDLLTLNLRFIDTAKKVCYWAFLAWGTSVFDRYIQNRLKIFQKNLSGMELATIVGKESTLYPDSFPLLDKLIGFWEHMEQQGRPLKSKVEKGGKTYFLTGIFGKQLNRPCFACSTDETVRSDIKNTALRLAVIGVLLMLLSVGIGLLLSRNLLSPVDLLSKGMVSMKNRDFAARVPVLSNDELGQLSEVFNQMMESMADLEVARIVQDTFFPQAPLSGDGWEIFGTSVPASRVGGDYFDYFPLKDGRWLILIGDVSGHGVAAALVVAMAKALVFHPSNPDKPSAILANMTHCLIPTLRHKRMMSCFIAIFDPRTRIFISSNAGHNYPYLIRSGKAEEIAGCNSLLGARSKRPYEDRVVTLAVDDAICFYTDGLIEALDETGEMIGYQQLTSHLPDLIKTSAQESEAAVRGWFKTVAAPGPLMDDITIVILQKNIPPPMGSFGEGETFTLLAKPGGF